MTTAQPASAVVVRVRLPVTLARLRVRRDLAASVGVPAHVTILFPFLPAERLDPAVRRELGAIARASEPFDVRFARVGRFPGVVYLAPEPATPFTRLTEAVVARFPDFPPYEGAFDDVVPHLTITEAADAPFDEIAARTARALPFERRVSALEVLVEAGDGRWHSRWRLELGVRP